MVHIGKKTGCPICKTPPAKAKVYARAQHFFITRCGKCKVPMVVARNHKKEEDFSKSELQHIIDRCTHVAGIVYPDHHFVIDRKTQHWADHMHWHIQKSVHVDDPLPTLEDMINESL